MKTLKIKSLGRNGNCPVCRGTGKIPTTDWLTKCMTAEEIAKEKEEALTDIVEARHAHWVVCGTFDDFLKCSLCESEKYPMSQVCNHKYCPNCGAKMDGRREK